MLAKKDWKSFVGRTFMAMALCVLGWVPSFPAAAAGVTATVGPSGAAIRSGQPETVVGPDTPINCTDGALSAALASGGTFTFNCGPNPVTILMSLKTVTNTTTTLDGGEFVTLDGSSSHQLFVITGTATLILKNLTLRHGSNTGGGGHNGGAIENHAVLEIDNSQLRSNSAGDGGGAVFNSSLMTITSSVVDTNTAYGGAGLFNHNGTLTAVNTILSNNAAVSGAGLTNDHGALILTNVSFLTNTASSYGGGMYNIGGALTATNTSFTNNMGVFSAGGLYNLDWSVATLINATFTRNHAQYAGAIANSVSVASPPPFLVTGSTFSGNTARVNGGAIHNTGPLAVENSSFISNSAGSDGGGLYNFVANAVVTTSSFISNSAVYGGGIENGAAQLTLVDSSLRANRAYTTTGGGQGNGGGLDNSGNSGATLVNVTLNDNYSAWAAGLKTIPLRLP